MALQHLLNDMLLLLIARSLVAWSCFLVVKGNGDPGWYMLTHTVNNGFPQVPVYIGVLKLA